MKYKIVSFIKPWYKIYTTFIVTPTIVELIKLCRGVNDTGIKIVKYEINVFFSEIFDEKEVIQSISTVLDAYILANPNACNKEDQLIQEYAKENNLHRFLKNYLDGK